MAVGVGVGGWMGGFGFGFDFDFSIGGIGGMQGELQPPNVDEKHKTLVISEE